MIEIELNNIIKNYGLKNVLNGMNLTLKTGERAAIIDCNGAGKSTVLKIIMKQENISAGTINIRKNATIGILRQIYEYEETNPNVYTFLQRSFEHFFELETKLKKLENEMSYEKDDEKMSELLQKYGNVQQKYIQMGGYDIQEKFNKICSGLQINEKMLNQNYNDLSGGEKTIVNLGALLLKEPSILLLDEPTNHLDMEKLEWLEKFLKEYKGTILMVSHDRYFLDKVATKTILLENGKEKIYLGNYSYFLKEDEKRTLAEFENYKNQQKMIKKMKESIKTLRKFGELAKNEMFFKRAKSIEKKLAKIEQLPQVDLEQKTLLNFKLNIDSRSGKDVIINNLNKNFESKNIFENANLQIHYGEKIALIGKNGTGKSTLLKIIVNEDCEYTGEIKIGQSVNIGYIPQEINFEDDNQTILNFFEQFDNRNETEIRTSLAKYMFRGNDVFKKVSSLSGGEKVRLILAKLLKQNINFLILDEPTNHIDIETRELLEEAIKEYSGTVLFVSHDRYFINNLAERIVEVKEKRFFSYVGNYDEYLRKIE
ncbi:MAG TPA: ATP-binding cassette domain-containing protein [Clostridiaceae bacterium]|jgi:ABC transporter related|nr:ATP-binding cassette domain-containing protein [Clostridiaceae bacterium]